MKTFKERLKAKKQTMVAGLIDSDTKAELDKIALATRRTKSGCMEIALRYWINKEKERIKNDNVAEVVA